MKKKFIITLFLFFNVLIRAQIRVEKQVITDNQLVISLTNITNFNIIKKGKNKYIHFPDFNNPVKAGEFILPEKDLYINIPFTRSPKITVSVLSKQQIPAIPEVNSKAIAVNDSTVKYEKIALKKIPAEEKLFNVKGCFWWDDYYILHLKIKLFDFDNLTRTTVKNKKIEVSIKFNNNPNYQKLNKLNNLFLSEILVNKDIYFKSNRADDINYYKDTTDSWIDYSKTYIKIGTAKDGIYRIDKNDLVNLGINVSAINPQTFAMFLKGEEIPIFVSGENDLTFDEEDFIEFVGIRNMGGHHREISSDGEAYKEYLGRYTDTTVYWLTWGGAEGKRVKISNGNEVVSNDTLKYYSEIEHFEKNKWFDFSCDSRVTWEMPFWCKNKTWHEGNLGVGTGNREFNVDHVYPNETVKLFIKLQDYASDIVNEAHNITIGLNNENFGDTVSIDKYGQAVIENVLNSNLLNNGQNNLTIKSLQTEAELNVCIFDWYEIEYPRYLYSDTDSLNFQFNFIENRKPFNLVLQNVNTNDFVLWKFGRKYTKYNLSASNGQIIFADSISNKDKFCFVDESKISHPKFYYSKNFINLRNSSNQADYILITHPSLMNTAEQYIGKISEYYGVTTKVVNVFDIYDEFNYGFFSPEPIRDFLKITHYDWQTPYPHYVFIVGKPTYDYFGRKEQNFGSPHEPDFVPSFGYPISDIWFTIWDSTGASIQQMSVGRLPVRNNGEFQYYLEKLINYETKQFDTWNKRYIFFSGGNFTEPSQIAMFKSANDYVIDNFVKPKPVGGNFKHFYKTVDPITNFGPYSQEEIDETISNGSLIIGYIGHSGTQTWDNSITQADQLQNVINRNPVISDFGCSTGKYGEPDVTSFSEQFVVKDGGQAINYLGNSSLGFTTTATLFPEIFYKKLLVDSVLNIGDAHRLAKSEMLNNYGDNGVYKLFTYTNELVGDPIIKVKLPEKPNIRIDNSCIAFSTDTPNDLYDSLNITLKYYNLGKVTDDSLLIEIKDLFNQESNYYLTKKVELPEYIDSLSFAIPILSKPGVHNLVVDLDKNNDIDEIYEDDNSLNISYTVYSSSVKLLFDYDNENSAISTLNLLNPVLQTSGQKYNVEFSLSSDFSNVISVEVPFDTIITRVNYPDDFFGKRVWLKAKIDGSENYSKTISTFVGNNYKFLQNDSVSFSRNNFINLAADNEIVLDSNYIRFQLISAGFNDGNTAVITENGQTFIPENTLRGHHVCLFDDSTYKFIEYEHFDLLGGGSSEANRYINFLDTISAKYFVAFAVSDEGAGNLSTELKNKIKEFGSVYIDSLVFRGSWAFLGKRGAASGTMPEAYSKPYEGRVQIDTTIRRIYAAGSLTTTLIGPASSWDSLVVSDSLPQGAEINYRILGERNSDIFDTLNYLNLASGAADLSFLNDSNYLHIKLLAEFKANQEMESPKLNSIGVNYKGVAELSMNYQVVSILKDSIRIGESNRLNYSVYNVGETKADSVSVKLKLKKPDNSTVLLKDFTTSIEPEENKKFSFEYIVPVDYGSGNMAFIISVDDSNKIPELYKDNNYYSHPFVVLSDTTKPHLEITFNGNDIIDGEYISSHPEIIILLNDETLVPISDTSAITIFLNNEPVYFSNNSDVAVSFSAENPKVKVIYTPRLKSGSYTLTVLGKNALGTLSDSAGITKSFTVDEEAKLLKVYNYPNPFSDVTYFTFKLTQIPDEMTIDIYTIAGRKIREMKILPSELNYDFNKILWDGCDQDGDMIANGVYFYKIKMKKNGKEITQIQKLAVMR